MVYFVTASGIMWAVVAHCSIRRLSSEGSRFGISFLPPRRNLGQDLHYQLPVRLKRETATQCRCCVGSASDDGGTFPAVCGDLISIKITQVQLLEGARRNRYTHLVRYLVRHTDSQKYRQSDRRPDTHTDK